MIAVIQTQLAPHLSIAKFSQRNQFLSLCGYILVVLFLSCSSLISEESQKSATKETVEALSEQIQQLSRMVVELEQKIVALSKPVAQESTSSVDAEFPLADLPPSVLHDSQMIAAIQQREKRKRYQRLPFGQKKEIPRVPPSRPFPVEEWLSRTSIAVDVRDHNRPFTYFEAIEPFSRKEIVKSTSFWQFLAGHRRAHDMIGAGIGYRSLASDDEMLWGVNSFFDYQGENNFGRMGLGAEMQWPIGAVRINGYCPTSRSRIIHRWEHYREREHVLRGADIEFEFPMPYVPWTLLYANGYYWDAHHHKDRYGGGASLLMYLAGFLRLETGWNCNTGWRGHHGHKNSFFVTLTLSAGRPDFVEHAMTDALFSGDMFVPKKLKNYLLQNVRREREMILERSFQKHHREHRHHHKTEIFVGGTG